MQEIKNQDLTNYELFRCQNATGLCKQFTWESDITYVTQELKNKSRTTHKIYTLINT